MRILGFVGSPRKAGNTEILVSEVLAGAAEKGAETAIYNLNELDIKGCQSCFYCSDYPGCARKDDMQKLLEEIRNADAVVIGTPIYMWQMSGQTKIFVDRMLPFLNPEYSLRGERDKGLVLVFTQWQEDPNAFADYFRCTGDMMESLGFSLQDILIGAGMEDKEGALKHTEVLASARKAGRALFK